MYTMLLRIFSLFLVLLTCTSCDFFKLKKPLQLQELDTSIDFSSVDASPTFENCVDFIDKTAKSNCFRITISTRLSKSLASYGFEVLHPIEEQIQVVLLIDAQGKITVKRIVSSDAVRASIQKLDSFIVLSVANLPTLFPALKRGIPVATQYQIPIEIRLNEK